MSTIAPVHLPPLALWTLAVCASFLLGELGPDHQAAARGQGRSLTPQTETSRPVHDLKAESYWLVDLPEGKRFDASGLLRTPDGRLLTVNDRGATLYELQLEDAAAHKASVRPVEGVFTDEQLAPWKSSKHGRFDCEGIAMDDRGRLYLCEESDRWILRFDPDRAEASRLEIDWSGVQEYFDPLDRNASFEGIAIGQGKLFVANERSRGRIIVVDLASLKVVGNFMPQPLGGHAADVHYSDLSWFDGSLYALLRQSQCVLRLNPETFQVEAEYRYGAIEHSPETQYRTFLPLGLMEGLAVDADWIWLMVDNNGWGRAADASDRRPTLFRCARPRQER